jgi:hypothetical protein
MGTWYQRFDRLAAFLDTNPSKADILRAVDALLDEAQAYRSQTMSVHVEQVMRRVIEEHGWTRDAARAEATQGIR